MKVDERTRETTRALNVAELGIGCNPKITQSIGYILTDEKVVGSVHLAFGNNFSYGGTSRSAMHWDFVTVPRVTMVARMEDGAERTVIKRGRLAKARG
jgi:aminopeptidase